VVLFSGPAIIALSSGFKMLLFGRVVTGIGVGLAFVLAPLYAAEVAPAGTRASIVSLAEILINAGVLLGYLSALLLNLPGLGSSTGWRLVTGLAALPAVVTFVCTPWLPESPRWLASMGRLAEAEAVLRSLGAGPRAATEGRKALEEALAAETSAEEAGWGEVLCPSPMVRRMLCVGLGCAFFQQISGSEVIVYYTPTILDIVGLHSPAGQNLGAVAMGVAKFAGACLGAAFLDWAGRRAGVLASCLGVTVCLLGLASCSSAALGILLLCAFMVFFEIGLALAAFVLGTECYPVAIRAKALALGMFTTRFLSGLVAVVFPPLLRHVSLTGCLWAFCAAAGLGVLWAALCVPETRGLSLEQSAQLFERPLWGGPAASERPAYGSLDCARAKAGGTA